MKRLLKVALEAAALILVFPAVLLYRFACLFREPYRALAGWSQALSLVPGSAGEYLRRAFYRQVLPECGPDACISFGTVLIHPTIRIGRQVYVGLYCTLEDATIEDQVLIGSHVSVISGVRHHEIDRLDVPVRDQHGPLVHVTIGRDSWIGERSLIGADVGRHCVIGAGAVVVKPIPDYAIAVGVPARVIRFRNGDGPPPQAAVLGERGVSTPRCSKGEGERAKEFKSEE